MIPRSNSNEQTIFSKGVPNNCCTNPKSQSIAKSQYTKVIFLLYVYGLVLLAVSVKIPPIIEIMILIIDMGNWAAMDSERPPFIHVKGIMPPIIRTWIKIVKE